MDKLERTKPELATAVVLRDLAKLSYAEIAEQLGVPLSTVRSRLHEGRRILQQYLGAGYL